MRYHDECLRWLQRTSAIAVTMIDATGKHCEGAPDIAMRRMLRITSGVSTATAGGVSVPEPQRQHLLQALQKGELLYRENQCTINHSGKKSVTNNVTFPIISRGKIIGAVELSRDVTHYERERTAPAARPTPKRRSGTEAK